MSDGIAPAGRPVGLWLVIGISVFIALALLMNAFAVFYGLAAGAGFDFRAGFILFASLGLAGPLACTAWFGWKLRRAAILSMALAALVLLAVGLAPAGLDAAGLVPAEGGVRLMPDLTRFATWLIMLMACTGYLYGLARRGILS